MALFYEIANSLYLYIMTCLTDFQGENILRNAQGIGLLIILLTVVSINILRTLIYFLKWFKSISWR